MSEDISDRMGIFEFRIENRIRSGSEVDRFLAVRVDLARFVALGQPDDKRRDEVAGEMQEDAEQRAGVAKRTPGAHVRGGGGADR